MRKLIFISLLILLNWVNLDAQPLKVGDKVEVDLLMSASREGTWQKATLINYDAASKMYIVKLANGNEMGVPSRTPEKWIRMSTETEPGKNNDDDDDDDKPAKPISLVYVDPAMVLKPKSCETTEENIKQRIRAMVAITFYNYEKQAVTFQSFKREETYSTSHSKYGAISVTPFRVEFKVDLLHKYVQGGKEFTEHKIWKFKRQYIYYPIPGNDCEFGISEGTLGELILSETL